ncbi:anhydro-N-acetylmuramic acid kinase [Hyunsoonleella sp. SJ7]|uniref:Anhydro-N-acetylmuramic acid kinase n=1 Tax=Hyunsoonleella aquatilis TaxID=2762758 RepID=A0A923HHP5_9FLAO|nr:anhydro-N-acetylmuramic acid kinase [Hyunsoonleella aquatilis]MBC3759510.1 anhydro-N-acetylmuramic acid kinase [Hyunsoonleella aquatilis]
MIKDSYNVIGVMSGTSLDGIDLVYAIFKYQDNWSFEIIHSETVSYGATWTEKLRSLVHLDPDALETLDEAYTRYLAKIIDVFILKNNILAIDAVCSHGHTALHKPEEGLTCQIGNKPIISKLLKQTVVCDFRVQDVKLGGQGAPLVPIGDKLLFSEYEFCLNLGGFANVSMDVDSERIAYDVCPVNIVLNHYVKQLGLDYDDKGAIASSGKIHFELLDKLNQLGFYHQRHPKSLGLEWVQSHIFPLIDGCQLEINDVLNTFCEHIAIQISKEIYRKKGAFVLVTGGGAYHSFLVNRIKFHSENKLVIPDARLVEFKEALIFALIGVRRLRNEINCLKSVTGASKNHSSGMIYQP